MVERNAEARQKHEQPAPCIEVENLAQKTGEIAARFYGEPSKQLDVIAITGTNGKTSCGRIIAELADKAQRKCMVLGTTGYGFSNELHFASHTTPDPIEIQNLLSWGLENGAQVASIEVSSHGLEQNRLSGVEVNTALFTNLTRDHLDYHGTMESYGHAKRKLFTLPGLNHAVINFDDAFGRELLATMPSTVKSYSYSLMSDKADLYAHKFDGSFNLSAQVKTPWGKGTLNSNLLGEFNLYNLLGAVAALCVSGISLEKVLKGIEMLEPIEGRMESFGSSTQPVVIVDFAHTPDALKQALTQLKQLQKTNNGKLICVLGCGGDRDRGKRPMMGAAADALCDHIILTDDNPRNESPQKIINDIIAGVTGLATYEVIHDRGEAIKAAIAGAKAQDCVLVAGKGHEQTQEYADSSIRFCDREVVQKILGGGV